MATQHNFRIKNGLEVAGTVRITSAGLITGTTTTQAAADNTTKLASTAYVTTALANLSDSAPSTLNTLNELAAALGDDANFSTTVTNSIAAKLPLAGGTLTGDVDIDATDDLRLRFLRGSTFKGGIQVPTSTGDMISGSAVDDLAIRSQANMLFSSGGNTERMRIDSSGNVGIGNSSAQTKLFVGSGSGTEGITIYSGTTGEGQLRFADGTSGSSLYQGRIEYNHSTNKLFLGAGGTTPVAIDSSGNVGIGTSSPDRQLELEGQGVLRLNATGSNTDPGIDFNTSSANDMQIRYRGGTDKLAIYSYGTSSDVLTIQKSDGNIGIGTDSPSTSLHVSMGSNGSGLIDVARFENEGTTVNDGARIQLTAGASTSGAGIGCLGDALNSAHLVLHAGGNTERMRIDSAGTMFVGTTSPTLHSAVRGIVFENGSIINDVTRGAGKSMTLAQNAAVDSGNTWAYLATDEASYYQQFGGKHYFATAPSGSAGADITFNNKMIIDNDSVVINEDGASNVDFRVESDNEAHNFFCDASSEIIHFGEGTNSDVQSVIPAGTLAGRRHGYHGGNRAHAGQTFKYCEGTSWTDAIKIDWNNASWGGVCMRITGMYYYNASNNFSIVIGFQGHSAYGSVSYDATSSGALNWTNALQLTQPATGETVIRQRAGDASGDVIFRYEWQNYNRSDQIILIIEQ